ncbi:MAG: cytochrome c oxidase accessory protein CcoG [Gammaproteobacteria bacterium]|uniref:cytochrome c oxidase accessory protein CcoG n=1 Tax=Pseudomaricurvus alcaniphilus TaxID=1166482 RepID=UPI001407E22C|nr:cytochrome c oxidase accessory protein CcoG [Pseudomaricurvus alcaniphilus]MBR9908912.1 cytochrome c oxidase accessory protein CcoG [Gammaproteobacteria bacterium]NHN37965.1 cytochrome c oxidase accessory protein CcoG [Pseudomaricurvus alcaniphilus]
MGEKNPVKEQAAAPEIRYRNLYEDTGKVYTRKVSGFFQKIRRYTGLPLIAGFLLMPWLVVDGRPAMLFDLPARKFHILWMTFWPQDGMLLAWLLIIAAFALFTVTVLVGRVWCGFTCPQTVWTLMYIWAEHFCEGDRNKRMKLDQQPWTTEKVLRKGSKHFLWVAIALITGLTFVGYFTPIRELILGFIPSLNESGMVTFDVHPVAAFWTFFFATATYVNAGWLREQVCKYMCPYARFQSVMYDTDTLAVHYDAARGEQRGPRKSGEDYKAAGKGDCIDCSWCVQVCPVDIDIREGLQYECINCGLCVDACNQVMDKMNYPRGLIRFTSEDQLENGATHFLRPRLYGYTLAVVAMIAAFVYAVGSREPVSVDVIRDRGARLYRISGDQVQNVYTVKINNMDQRPHSYEIAVEGAGDFHIRGYRPLQLEEGEIFTLPVRVSVPRKDLKTSKNTIYVTVTATDDPAITAREEASFIGPSMH